MNTHPGLLGVSAMLLCGGFFAWPIAASRLSEAERMVLRHEREIESLQRKVAQLEGNASHMPRLEATSLRREVAFLRERVDSLGVRDGRTEGDAPATKAPVPAPATPPR